MFHKNLYLNNKIAYDARIKLWDKNNLEKRREIAKRFQSKRRKTVKGKLNNLISANIGQGLINGKGGVSWQKYLGFTINDLHSHIEKQFTEGMNWESFSDGDIEIDHIIPIVAFDYQSSQDEAFHLCWGLINLRPLWKVDNRKKSDLLPDGTKARDLSQESKIKSKDDYFRVRYKEIDNFYQNRIFENIYSF